MDEIYENLWKCSQCQMKDIPGSQKVCPTCGNPHDSVYTPEERYYRPANPRVVTDPEEIARAEAGEDWSCGNCDQPNLATATECEFCHEPLGFNDIVNRTIEYNDQAPHHDERPHPLDEMIESDSDKGQRAIDTKASGPRKMPPLVLRANERPRTSKDVEYTQVEWNPATPAATQAPIIGKLRPYLGKIGIVVAVLTVAAILFGAVSCIREYTATVPGTVTVTGVHWERSIAIMQYNTFHEEGWSYPYGARVRYSERRQNGTKQVHDHWDTRKVKEWKEDGTENKKETYDCSYEKDLGNGYSKKISKTCTTTVKVPRKVLVEREEKVEVFRQERVYDDWYFFDVDRWVVDRWVSASGSKSDVIVWPVVTGLRGKDRSAALIGDERSGDKHEAYTVTYTDSNHQTHTDQVDRGQWDNIDIDEEADAQYNKRSGNLSSVDWNSVHAPAAVTK